MLEEKRRTLPSLQSGPQKFLNPNTQRRNPSYENRGLDGEKIPGIEETVFYEFFRILGENPGVSTMPQHFDKSAQNFPDYNPRKDKERLGPMVDVEKAIYLLAFHYMDEYKNFPKRVSGEDEKKKNFANIRVRAYSMLFTDAVCSRLERFDIIPEVRKGGELVSTGKPPRALLFGF